MFVLFQEAQIFLVDLHQVQNFPPSPTPHHILLLDKFLHQCQAPGDQLTKVVGKSCLEVGGGVEY